MSNVLEVRELTKQYNAKRTAADKISFSIGEGEIFALIGPNGAGKTTTIRMISTLLTPTDGDAVVAGHSVVKEPAKVREQFIAQYEDKYLNPYIAAGNGFIDEVIEPKSVRDRLVSAFENLKNKKKAILWKKHGNIPL